MPSTRKPTEDMPKWMLPFQSYDPIRSFEQNKDRKLLDDSGQQVGTAELWDLGKDAYEFLTADESEPPTKEELIEEYFDLEVSVIEMLGLINYIHGVHLTETGSGKHFDFADWCKDVECANALIVLKKISKQMKGFSGENHDPISEYLNFDESFALCILVIIDNAIICDHLADTAGFSYCLGLSNNLSMIIKSTEMLKQQATERAIKASTVRHKENREMRQEAIDYYEQHKETFASRAAAARVIAKDIVPVVERTVDSWLKHHINTQSARRQ